MPLKVGSVILCQYWPTLVVCAASSAEVRMGVCTTSVLPSELVSGCGAIDYTEATETVNDGHRVVPSAPVHSGSPQASREKDDLASGAWLQDFFVRASRLREGQFLADHGAERAVLHACEERGVDFRHFRGLRCPQSECANGSATRHQVAGSYGHIAAACPVHQDRFAGSRFGEVMQRLVRGTVGNPNSSALFEGNVFGQGVYLLFERERIFGVRSGQSSRCVNAIPRLHLGYAGPDGFNRAGGVRARRVRQLRLDGVSAGAHVGIVGIDARGAYMHQQLTRIWFGCGDLF